YSIYTHEQIVFDAFIYVIDSRHDKNVYYDNSTGESDFRLFRDVLAPEVGDEVEAQRIILEAVKSMAEESGDTDRYEDVRLSVPGFGDYTTVPTTNLSFTMFSHFINVHSPGTIWDFSGYNFDWVRRNGACSDPSLEDRFANFLIKY